MADINVKHRVIMQVEGKPYDLKPSGNPHAKLSKAVVKALEDGGHLAEEAAVKVVQGGASAAELQAANAEITRLTGENAQLTTDLAAVKAELDTANAEITRLTGENAQLTTDLAAVKAELDTANAEITKLNAK